MTETVEGNQPVVEIPFGFQGKVFRSPMPFSQYDRFNQIWSSYLNLKIQTVLVLAGVEEMLIYSERNLLDFYKWNGIHQLHFPIQDYTVPEDQSEFDGIIKTVIQKAESGGILAVHCLAGIGRTGLVLAAIAKRHLGLDGEGAIRWVRCFVPGAIENQTQEDFIRKYQVSFNTNN